MISILDGPIDTLQTKNVPVQLPITLAIRFLWHQGELGREHLGNIYFQDEDGKQLIIGGRIKRVYLSAAEPNYIITAVVEEK